jgi:hypothetical protein
MSEEIFVRDVQAARLLNVSVSALRRWRREGRGPAFLKIERCVRYRVSDIELFLAKRVHPAKESLLIPGVKEAAQ